MKYKMNSKGVLAISQIAILIIGIFAMVFLITSADRVSATDPVSTKTNLKQLGDACNANSDCSSGRCDTSSYGTKICLEQVSSETPSTTNEEGRVGRVADATIKGATAVTSIESLKNSKIVNGAIKKVFPNFKLTNVADPTKLIVSEPVSTTPKVTMLKNLWSGAKGVFTEGASQGFVANVGSILAAAAIAAVIAIATRYIAQAVGASTNQAQILGWSAGGATFGGLLAGKYLAISLFPGIGWAVGGALLLVSVLAFYDKESVEVVAYECLPWQAVKGGDNCELCNGMEIPCSEYQCRSLGQGCRITNAGTDEEICFNAGRGDITPPQVSAWDQVLSSEFRYNPITTNFPEDRGVKIISIQTEDGCLPPFTEFTLGVTVDEPANCKYDFNRTTSIEEMNYFFSNGRSKYNHSIDLNFPDMQSLNSGNLTYREGFNELFVRCEDEQGNSNTANFVFRFCIDEAPDLREPKVVAVNPLNKAFLPFDTLSEEITLYLNKPSDCAWDHFDQGFDNMWATNPMECAQNILDGTPFNNQIVYPCKTTLIGLQNYEENNFYFRCKSFPEKNESERVEMERAYKYTLTGTRPLVIEEVGPSGLIKDSAGLVKVEVTAETKGGANEGNAFCSLAETDEDKEHVLFFNTGEYTHSQSLYLSSGEYNYFIKCCDIANNCDTKQANFEVELDSFPPIIARAYYKDNKMNLVTNENSTCVYSTKDCAYSFLDGTKITSRDTLKHTLPWDTKTELFVKCEDIYGNRPLSPIECSMVIRAYDKSIGTQE